MCTALLLPPGSDGWPGAMFRWDSGTGEAGGRAPSCAAAAAGGQRTAPPFLTRYSQNPHEAPTTDPENLYESCCLFETSHRCAHCRHTLVSRSFVHERVGEHRV